jgi:membrane-associated phospholipid phosphatase
MKTLSHPISLAAMTVVFILMGMVGGTDNGIDGSLSRGTASLRSDHPQLTPAVEMLTRLGGGAVTLGLTAVAALFLFARGNRGRALFLLATVLAERLFVDLLKEAIGRARPAPDLHEVMTTSLAYPSGHAANSMTAWLAVALLAVAPAFRRPAVVVALIITLLVGWSRVWLGVHWPSDLIGGWALGLLAVGLALHIGERTGVLNLEPEHDVVARHFPPAGEDHAA